MLQQCRPSSTAARTPDSRVQDFTAEKVSGEETYETVTRVMCQQVTFVNPSTGKVLGEDDNE
jgi:hypothetical protein